MLSLWFESFSAEIGTTAAADTGETSWYFCCCFCFCCNVYCFRSSSNRCSLFALCALITRSSSTRRRNTESADEGVSLKPDPVAPAGVIPPAPPPAAADGGDDDDDGGGALPVLWHWCWLSSASTAVRSPFSMRRSSSKNCSVASSLSSSSMRSGGAAAYAIAAAAPASPLLLSCSCCSETCCLWSRRQIWANVYISGSIRKRTKGANVEVLPNAKLIVSQKAVMAFSLHL
mmetsp:Transcript_24175/g.40268  ORF Transcript_24175/g.40268 Transcript_24175/m.40268 type:complete len:231 (-) Transcript_24175:401-1093(-)